MKQMASKSVKRMDARVMPTTAPDERLGLVDSSKTADVLGGADVGELDVVGNDEEERREDKARDGEVVVEESELGEAVGEDRTLVGPFVPEEELAVEETSIFGTEAFNVRGPSAMVPVVVSFSLSVVVTVAVWSWVTVMKTDRVCVTVGKLTDTA